MERASLWPQPDTGLYACVSTLPCHSCCSAWRQCVRCHEDWVWVEILQHWWEVHLCGPQPDWLLPSVARTGDATAGLPGLHDGLTPIGRSFFRWHYALATTEGKLTVTSERTAKMLLLIPTGCLVIGEWGHEGKRKCLLFHNSLWVINRISLGCCMLLLQKWSCFSAMSCSVGYSLKGIPNNFMPT